METPPLPVLPSRHATLLIIGGFFLAGLLVYGQSLRNDFVRWDDGMLIYENPAVREISPWSLKRVFTTYDPELYIPLTFLTYQIDYQLWGTNPFGYHLTSLLLHIGNALLVAWLAFLLSGSYRSVNVVEACHPEPVEGRHAATNVMVRQAHHDTFVALCGLLFLLHPLHTEAVAWASGRKDVLSTFFFLASLIAYVRWREDDRRNLYLWSIVFFVLGLMSKVMVITLPIVLLLLDWREGRRWDRRMFTEKLPYLGIAVLFGIVAMFGKTAVVASSTLWQKIIMACKSTVFYLEKIFVPVKFSLLYPYTKAITISSPDFFVPAIIVALILLVVWFGRHRWRNVAFGILFYLVTVAPTFINFAKGGDLDVYFASDRYAYIPSIGVFFLVCFILFLLSNALAPHLRRGASGFFILSSIPSVGAAGLVAMLAFLSYQQSKVWADTESLFANVLAHYPDSSHVAHNNLGNMHRLRGDIDKSIEEYTEAIRIRPHAKTYSNLGAAYRKKGMMTEALAAYEEALKVDTKSAIAHIGLGLVHAEQGRWSEAEAEYTEGLRYDPTEEVGYTNLGVLYTNQGRLEEAIAMYRLALAQNPFMADAHYNLGVALSKKGDSDGAIAAYGEVTHIAPSFIPARINLGLLLHRGGDIRGARTQFKAILTVDPQNRIARAALEQMR